MCFLQANWTEMLNMFDIVPTNTAKQDVIPHLSQMHAIWKVIYYLPTGF